MDLCDVDVEFGDVESDGELDVGFRVEGSDGGDEGHGGAEGELDSDVGIVCGGVEWDWLEFRLIATVIRTRGILDVDGDTYNPRDKDSLMRCRSTRISEPGGTCSIMLALGREYVLFTHREVEAIGEVHVPRSIDPSVEFRIDCSCEGEKIELFNQPTATVRVMQSIPFLILSLCLWVSSKRSEV